MVDSFLHFTCFFNLRLYTRVDSLHSEGLDMDGTMTYFKDIVDDLVSEIQLMESLKVMFEFK